MPRYYVVYRSEGNPQFVGTYEGADESDAVTSAATNHGQEGRYFAFEARSGSSFDVTFAKTPTLIPVP